MSLKEPVAEQQDADGVTQSATATVGHAAPLRAKIAQFESKGGVPVPRGSESFGFGAPPVVDRGQQRPGQLYGNRMKPVWVPAIPGRSSQAARVWDHRAKDVIRRMQGVTREESRELTPPRPLPSPPDSTQEESNSGRHSPDYSFLEDPEHPAEDVQSRNFLDQQTRDMSDKENIDCVSVEDRFSRPTFVPAECEELPTFVEGTQQVLGEVDRAPSSPPLPPSPPLSPLEEPDVQHAIHEHAESDDGKATIAIEPSRRPDYVRQRQRPSLSIVVHAQTREPAPPPPMRKREKRLPPTPTPLRADYTSNSDLAALLADAAALERVLLAGELPADAIRRLSARPPPPVGKDWAMGKTMAAHPAVFDGKPATGPSLQSAGAKMKRAFYDQLLRKRSPKQKGGVAAAAPGEATTDSAWFFE